MWLLKVHNGQSNACKYKNVYENLKHDLFNNH